VQPKNLVNTIAQKPIKGISLNFGDRYIGVLIGFWDQRSRSQQAMTQKLYEHHISKTTNHPILFTDDLDLYTVNRKNT